MYAHAGENCGTEWNFTDFTLSLPVRESRGCEIAFKCDPARVTLGGGAARLRALVARLAPAPGLIGGTCPARWSAQLSPHMMKEGSMEASRNRNRCPWRSRVTGVMVACHDHPSSRSGGASSMCLSLVASGRFDRVMRKKIASS